jgi:hypothetical protein
MMMPLLAATSHFSKPPFSMARVLTPKGFYHSSQGRYSHRDDEKACRSFSSRRTTMMPTATTMRKMVIDMTKMETRKYQKEQTSPAVVAVTEDGAAHLSLSAACWE